MPIDLRVAHALEEALAGVPGVLGAVVLDDANDGAPLEVQTFVEADADVDELAEVLRRVAADVAGRDVTVVPLQLAGPTGPAPDIATAVGPGTDGGRPRLVSVVLDSSFAAARHEALVSLQGAGIAAGRASVGRDPSMALVTAACQALAGGDAGDDAPVARAVERISVDGIDVVVVAVTVRGRPLVGTAVLDDEPEPAAVVRATLDAVNRWYGRG